MEKKPKSKEQLSKEEINREIARMALQQTVNKNQLQFKFKEDKNDG
jgi:hypothetical protein